MYDPVGAAPKRYNNQPCASYLRIEASPGDYWGEASKRVCGPKDKHRLLKVYSVDVVQLPAVASDGLKPPMQRSLSAAVST